MAKNIYRVQVLYEDTDHTGFVYHVNYLKYFERARQIFVGIKRMQKLWEENVNFAIVNINIDYKKGAVFGDHLIVETKFCLDGDYKFVCTQTIHEEEKTSRLASAETTLVCIDNNKYLIKIPDDLKTILLS